MQFFRIMQFFRMLHLYRIMQAYPIVLVHGSVLVMTVSPAFRPLLISTLATSRSPTVDRFQAGLSIRAHHVDPVGAVALFVQRLHRDQQHVFRGGLDDQD